MVQFENFQQLMTASLLAKSHVIRSELPVFAFILDISAAVNTAVNIQVLQDPKSNQGNQRGTLHSFYSFHCVSFSFGSLKKTTLSFNQNVTVTKLLAQ